MNWDNLRGAALEKPKKQPLNIKLLEYRIMFIIREELKNYIAQINISNNKFGKWDIV
jgi:hypothetical protein